MKLISRNSPTVFLTGGPGFVGRALVERLLAEGYHVTALARRTKLPGHLQQPGVSVISGDVRDEACLAAAVAEADYVIHAAAAFGGSWEDFYATNVRSTQALLEASRKHKIKRFVFISSASVYAHANMNSKPVFTEDMPYEEDAHAAFYAKSKIAAEKLVWQYVKEHSLPCVIFRPGAIYGPGGSLFPATTGLGLGEEKTILIGNSRTKLPLSYVENVAEAVVRSLQMENVSGECFNHTEDETLTRKEWIEFLRARVNPNVSVIPVPRWVMSFAKFTLKQMFKSSGKKPPLSDLHLKLYCTSIAYSNEKFKRVFGAQPFVSFRESLERTAKWQHERRTPKRSHGLAAGNVVIPSGRKLRVGVIGCGNISAAHLGIIKQMRNVGEIVIADPREEARRAMAGRFGIAKAHADYRELLEKERPDVVHVLAPPQLHAAIAIEAARRGSHVLVEKPMAVDAEEARAMLQAAKAHNVKLGVVHNHLYDRVMLEARQILARGALGRLTFVESWYGTQFSGALPFDPKSYWGFQLPGSIYQDYMPHALYVLLEFMPKSQVKEVLAACSGNIPNVEHDELKVILQNEQTLGMIHLSLSVSPRYQFVRVFGTSGSMTVDFLNKVVLLDQEIKALPRMFNRSVLAEKHAATLARAGVRNALQMFRSESFMLEGTARLIPLFYRSILLDEPPPVLAGEGWEAMRLMDEIWQKMKPPAEARAERARAAS
jgi:predicted dehydrogenase/nucleoside-diphosphate-sugar epimerase